MNNSAYLWKTAFGWAALVYSDSGAVSFDFGFSSRTECLTRARAANKKMLDACLQDGSVGIIKSVDSGPGWLTSAVESIDEYFAGSNPRFILPLDFGGYSEFQKAVWRAAMKIPYGETRAYSWIAEQAGSAGATRAAGSALGANPLPVIVPCHRIVRSDGTLGGFGMGLPMKERLLKLEGRFS